MTNIDPKFNISCVSNIQPDFISLEKKYNSNPNYNLFSIDKIQFYYPILQLFSHIDENNNNSLSFNHKYHFSTLDSIIEESTKNIIKKPVFIKCSPLINPTKYLVGKYKNDDSIHFLPSIDDKHNLSVNPKMLDRNNISYIDNFFSLLCSKLLHQHNFLHGIDYYGSFIGIQKKFKTNISDDLEFLYSHPFFSDNINKLYDVENLPYQIFSNGSRCNKQKIKISTSPKHNLSVYSLPDLHIEEITPENTTETIYINNNIVSNNTDSSDESDSDSSSDNSDIVNSDDEDEDDDEDEVYYQRYKCTNCGFITTNDDPNCDKCKTTFCMLAIPNNSDSEDDSEDDSEEDEDEEEDENINAYIYNFPIQSICLEKCQGTFDELLENNLVDETNSAAYLMQIIMTLIVFQKTFSFTHNDLHTNNIMYINTDLEFIYYQYDSNIYKVPTYGKIFKLIDFGRGIYKFQNNLFCSDSFAPGDDAATQYNFEPYYNPSKPIIEPNMSFDLCRLGCSIFDFIIDSINDTKLNDFQQTIARWCTDDYGKNVLYKKNGEERYPDFKLYKMIARTVHNHLPQKQLSYPFFSQFLCKTNNNPTINIDAIPSYYN